MRFTEALGTLVPAQLRHTIDPMNRTCRYAGQVSTSLFL